jgi:Zn-dependent protease with chaperone function
VRRGSTGTELIILINMQRSILFLLVSLVYGCATAPTVDSLKQWQSQEVRVLRIAHNILTANYSNCSDKKPYYGFIAISLNRDAKPADVKVWVDAFHAQQLSTVIIVVPGSSVEQSGLRVGDVILSVNDIPWSTSDAEQTRFKAALRSAMLSPTMHLVVRRNESVVDLSLRGEESCAADVAVVNDQGSNAHAGESHILVEAGLEKLLSEDAELAFVISHELAHVILGHTKAERKQDLEYNQLRSVMERDADALGIQLMVRAGYDPEAATTAIKKMDYANRGPISRWIGLYGAYMPTEKRIAFLRACAAEISK